MELYEEHKDKIPQSPLFRLVVAVGQSAISVIVANSSKKFITTAKDKVKQALSKEIDKDVKRQNKPPVQMTGPETDGMSDILENLSDEESD